jgi:hypothetical protein
MILIFALWIVVLTVCGVWLVSKALEIKGRLWRATLLLGAIALLTIDTSILIQLTTGCLDLECAGPESADVVKTVGYVGLAIAITLGLLAAIERYLRESGRP